MIKHPIIIGMLGKSFQINIPNIIDQITDVYSQEATTAVFPCSNAYVRASRPNVPAVPAKKPISKSGQSMY